jgi:hypothetical protein
MVKEKDMKTLFRRLSAVGAITLWLASNAPAQEITLLVDTFESDTVDTTPRSSPLDVTPATWVSSPEFDNGNGLVDTSVEGVSSPRNGGSRSMLLFDNNTVDDRMNTYRAWTPVTSGDGTGLRITMDLRVNSETFTGGNVVDFGLYQGVLSSPSTLTGFRLANNGSSDGIVQLRRFDTDAPFQDLSVGTWYRLIAEVSRPGEHDTQTVRVIQIGGALDITHSMSFFGGGNTYANYGSFLIASPNGGSTIYDLNLDNFQVDIIPEPSSLVLLASALAVLARPRNRFTTR